jgi:phage-related protein
MTLASTATLNVKILADASQASAGFDKASSKMGKFRDGVKAAAVPAALAGAAIIKLGADAVESASHLEQAMGGVEAVFGKNAKTIERWATRAADSIGLAKSEYGDLATLIGSQMKNAGLPMDQVTRKTGSLIKMGADLAAMYGGTTKEAVEALSSAFKGEFDPLEKYGASLNATKIKAEMTANGQGKLKGQAAETAKAMTTLALITKQTADAHGAAARESDTAAAKAQQLAANIENLKASLGEALLPVISKAAEGLVKLASFMAEHTTTVQIMAGVILALAVAVGILNVAMLVLSANPIVIAIAALVAWFVLVGVALTLAYKKSETFRTVVNAAFDAVKVAAAALGRAFGAIKDAAVVAYRWIIDNWRLLAAILLGPFGIAVGQITKHWDTIKKAAETAFNAISAVAGTIASAIVTQWHKITALAETTADVAARVVKAFSGMKAKITGVFAGAITWLSSVGRDIVQGLINGIDSLTDWVQGAVEKLADKIPDWAAKKLGIRSPSTVMKAIGQDVSRGLALGITDGAAAVRQVAADVADSIAKTINSRIKNDKAARAETSKVIASLSEEYAALTKNAQARKVNNDQVVAAKDNLRDLTQQMNDYAASVTNAAQGFASVAALGNLGEGVEVTAASIAAAMGERVAAVEEYSRLLTQLKKAGLSQQIIDDLARAGVEGGLAQAQAIAAGGPAAVAQFNALQTRLTTAATALGDNTAAYMYAGGVKSAQAFLDGLLLDQEKLEAAADRFAKALTKAIQKALANVKIPPPKAKAPRVAVPAAAVTGAGTTAAAGTTSAAGTGAPINITVNGAIDPEATARQIRRLLAGHDRRVGLRTA